MNRRQRQAHRLTWWVLAPLLLGLFLWAGVFAHGATPSDPGTESQSVRR